jgi:ketosteroid isomerase-like protein
MVTQIELLAAQTQTQALTEVPRFERIPPELESWLDPIKFEHMQRIAKMFAASDMVPQHFRGNVANCAIILHMAYRMGIDPMMALQNMHVVHGNPGMSAQLGIALANKSQVFSTPIDFDLLGTDDNLIVTAKATLSKTNKQVSLSVSYKQAVTAGWTKMKDGGVKPFWKAMPEQMLRYRAATFLIRTYAPDVLLGMHTAEEWEDLGDNVQAPATPAVLAAKIVAPAVELPSKSLDETPTNVIEKEKSKPLPRRSKAEEKTEEKPAEATTTRPPLENNNDNTVEV